MSSSTSWEWTLSQTARVLSVIKFVYAPVILGVFLVAFIIYGVRNAPEDGDRVQIHSMRGPGGRPLPHRRVSAKQLKEAAKVKDFSPNAKLIFKLFSTGILLTFLGQAVLIILQVLAYRQDKWWPGQTPVVSQPFHESSDLTVSYGS